MGAIEDFLAGVSNKSLCNWFFTMFVLALVGAVYQFMYMLFAITMMKNKGYGFLLVFVTALVLSISCFQALFLYSLCDRSLNQGE
jgi:membrane protein YdbS with pleckstrin-like domain